jgi:polyhydroxyalkanoate synthesis regulator phasin
MAKAKAGSKGKRTGGSKKRSTRATTSKAPSAGRSDKSVQAFRDELDRSLTLSRDRLQEVFDDAVQRGRMTRDDANELVSSLVTRGRQASDDLIRDLEKLLDQARREVETRGGEARKRVSATAARASRTVRDVADPALARADQVRRRAGGPGSPITAYDQLTAAQVKSRLTDLSKAELRKVRTQEKNGKARKSVLAEIDKRLK